MKLVFVKTYFCLWTGALIDFLFQIPNSEISDSGGWVLQFLSQSEGQVKF